MDRQGLPLHVMTSKAKSVQQLCVVCMFCAHTLYARSARHDLFGRYDEAVDSDESKFLNMHLVHHVFVLQWACMQSHSAAARLSKLLHVFDRHVSSVPTVQR